MSRSEMALCPQPAHNVVLPPRYDASSRPMRLTFLPGAGVGAVVLIYVVLYKEGFRLRTSGFGPVEIPLPFSLRVPRDCSAGRTERPATNHFPGFFRTAARSLQPEASGLTLPPPGRRTPARISARLPSRALPARAHRRSRIGRRSA